MRDLAKLSAILWVCSFSTVAASAKQVGEAVADMGDVDKTDPGGFTLMVFCIGFLFLLVGTLIGVTTWYFLKGKKKSH
ncbi:MAG TPA: hypothetical protein V6C81_25210 [Planktothrix sp.]